MGVLTGEGPWLRSVAEDGRRQQISYRNRRITQPKGCAQTGGIHEQALLQLIKEQHVAVPQRARMSHECAGRRLRGLGIRCPAEAPFSRRLGPPSQFWLGMAESRRTLTVTPAANTPRE